MNIKEALLKDLSQDSTFGRLDISRKEDVLSCLTVLRTSKNEAEKLRARQALSAIYKEVNNKRLRDARQWYINEKEQGHYENAKNFLSDVEKSPDIYNPYRTRR